MDVKIKAVLAILPFGIAIAVGSSLAYPAYTDFTAKAQQVDDKKKEQDELQTKLTARARIQKEKVEMERDISALRDSVPKKAEVEMLNIDLEKMCVESGVDLVSFRSPTSEELKKSGAADPPPESAGTNMSKGKAALANKVKDTLAPVSGAAGAAAAAASGAKPKISSSPDAGLSKFNMQIKVIGDYAGIMQLAKKLESYQRVIAIADLQTSVPKKEANTASKGELPDDAVPTESDEVGDYHRLNGTFMITAYYLP